MGQLERYGLYVLCVVIVLILGVAIWGGDPAPVQPAGPAHQLDRPLVTDAQPAAPEGRTAQPTAPARRPGAQDADALGRRDPFFDQVASVDDEIAGVAAVAPAGESSGAPARQRAPRQERPLEQPKKVAPEPVRTLRTYVVRENDTMEGISRDILGSIRHVATIKKLNPKVNPRKMRVGQVLKLPWLDSGTKATPDLTAARETWRDYTVKTGDSAYAISIAMYGTAAHANKILEANGIRDPHKMRPKTVIKIPPLK